LKREVISSVVAGCAFFVVIVISLLRLWSDKDRNGTSEPDELEVLPADLVIELKYRVMNKQIATVIGCATFRQVGLGRDLHSRQAIETFKSSFSETFTLRIQHLVIPQRCCRIQSRSSHCREPRCQESDYHEQHRH
jgi:hypothetical protein